MARVTVVLVRPENPANVGASARAIRNTGLQALSLVDPGDWRTVDCWRTAWGAHEVLEAASVHAELRSALAGSVYAAAFSGRREREAPVLDVREVAAELAGLGAEEPACLVFGPESSGLTGAERALCGRQALIPSHPDQPSLNLAQAVMVAAYEVFRAAPARPAAPRPRPARHEEREALLGSLQEGLSAIGALSPAHAERYLAEWRALLHRASLTERELKMLEHVAWKMKRSVPRG